MPDLAFLHPSFLLSVVWQTTLALAVGALASLAWYRHPGRAHACLALAMLAALLLPLASLSVRHAGAGVLPPRSIVMHAPAIDGSFSSETPVAIVADAQVSTVAAPAWPWETLALAGWAGVAALLLLRTLFLLASGIAMLSRARALVDGRVQSQLEQAARSLRVTRMPIAFASNDVRCPAIWCWSMPPTLLLPTAMLSGDVAATRQDWLSIFSHELAHLVRRDHLAAVLAELAACLLWWNPLAWWSRRRLHALSDEACDRWALAAGRPADHYAETLVNMAAEPRMLAALSMRSGRHDLSARIASLLGAAPGDPRAGRRWTAAAVGLALAALLIVSALQPGAAETVQNLLANPDAEKGDTAPETWTQGATVEGVVYLWDKNVAHGGKASLCMKKTASRFFPIAQWTQSVPAEKLGKATKVKLAAWVKAEKAQKATLDVLFLDASGKWLGHKWAAYIGAKEAADPPADHDWKKYEGEVEVPAGSAQVVVGLQDYGPGTVWFDDVELTVSP